MKLKLKRLTALLCALALLLTALPAVSAADVTYILPVFETSDVHGFLVNTSGGSADTYAYRMAYIAGAVDKARTDSDAATTLLLDGGDIYQGHVVSNLQNGEPLTEAYAAMEYDAVALGNHEFDWDVTTLCDSDGTMSGYTDENGNWVDVQIPVLCGNLYEAGTSNRVDFTQDYVILDKTATAADGSTKPVRVAVIGYADDYSSSIMAAKIAPYTIDDSAAALNKVKTLAASLKADGEADAVVVLSHAGASSIASQLSGSQVDLVCGGHTHTSASGISGNVSYIQPTNQAQAYGYAELSFTADGTVSVSTKTVISVTDANCLAGSAALNPEVLALSQRAIDGVSEQLNTVIGYITEPIQNTSTSAGNFVCDLMNSATGTQAAFTNSGGIRTTFEVDGATRNVTVGDIYTMLPFCNLLYLYSVTYEQLADAALSRRSLYMSGVDLYYSGNTMTALVVDGKCIYKNGTWADGWKDAKVLVSVNEYVATGYSPFTDWTAQGCLIDSTSYVDNETLVAELQRQAEQTGGLITVDSTQHRISGSYSGNLYDGKPACEHQYQSVVTEATCTAGGYTTYTCLLCGDSYRGDITAALGHSYVQVGYTPPEGGKDGSAVYTCSRCGDTYTEVIPVSGYTITTSCTGGTITPTAKVPYGEDFTVSYTPQSDKVLLRLTVDGVALPLFTTDSYGVNHDQYLEEYTFCDVRANHTISAEFGQNTQTQPCTLTTSCTEGGSVSAGGDIAPYTTCVVDITPDEGYYIYDVMINGKSAGNIDRYAFSYTPGADMTLHAEFRSLGGHTHSYETTVVAPTCTEPGYTLHTCVCGDSYRTDETEALGHDFVSETLIHAYTCDEQSCVLHTCTRCGESYTEWVTEPCPSEGFTDLDTGRWYHIGVDYVISTELMNGLDAEHFAPNQTISRAMMVTILYRLAGAPDMSGYETAFTDVAENRYFTQAVVWGEVYGIVNGVTDTTFAPNAPVTREQIATFLYRYDTLCCHGGGEADEAVLAAYTDGTQISSYARQAMAWAVSQKIILGQTEKTLCPKNDATRAQFANMLYRYVTD